MNLVYNTVVQEINYNNQLVTMSLGFCANIMYLFVCQMGYCEEVR